MRPSPLLDAPGAVAADSGAVPGGASAGPAPAVASGLAAADPDALVPAHYGDPLREQRLLADGLAVSARVVRHAEGVAAVRTASPGSPPCPASG